MGACRTARTMLVADYIARPKRQAYLWATDVANFMPRARSVFIGQPVADFIAREQQIKSVGEEKVGRESPDCESWCSLPT